MGYLEKARVDSVRRRPAAAAEMAQVTILNATFYSVTIDSTGDGTLDAPQDYYFTNRRRSEFSTALSSNHLLQLAWTNRRRRRQPGQSFVRENFVLRWVWINSN